MNMMGAGRRDAGQRHNDSSVPAMVKLVSVSASGADTAMVVEALDVQVAEKAARADFVFAFYGCQHDDVILHRFLRHRFPHAQLLGGTSCTGLMTDQRLLPADGIGLLLVDDPAGEYGVAAAPLGDNPQQAAEAALAKALSNAGCDGELPELIWIYQAPRCEEDIIDGLRHVVGDRCPIIGGSSADDTISGNWRQLSNEGCHQNSVVVAVLFPSGGISYAFQGGYEPAGPSGVVTQLGFDHAGPSGIVTQSRGRTITAIDGMPAGQVYNGWIGHRLNDKVSHGGNILTETSLLPLAMDAGQIDGISHFVLIHPATIESDGALSTFAAVEQGTRLYSMRGDRSRLVDRAQRVAAEAADNLPGGAGNLAGGLMVYCAGCMLAVNDRMPDVVDKVSQGFAKAPFLGCFTFGEQGQIARRNVHGNLMISAIAFGR
jgi:hypothetical protein